MPLYNVKIQRTPPKSEGGLAVKTLPSNTEDEGLIPDQEAVAIPNWAPKSLQMVTAVMRLTDACSL